MLMPSRPIHELPAETRARLRSTQVLTSLPQIVSELVQNSLDASARQINVGIDCEEWSCWVGDDGHGISKDGMSIIGRGDRYGTSKAYEPASLNEVKTFGFRGEALASAADLSCLEISSRTIQSRESWSVIIKERKCLYNGPSIRWRRESPGTVVYVRDAFYNLPVRRRSHPTPSRTLELIRKELESIALVFPHVSFSLENTRKALEQEGSLDRGRILSIPKTGSGLKTFKHLFGRALTQHVEEIDAALGEAKLEGFISLVGAHSRAHQYLYVNRHPLLPGDLHRAIDNQFTNSSFAKHALDESGETSLLRPGTRRSPRKAERKPVYVLNLTIPSRDLDNCLEPAKASVHLRNNQVVLDFVASTIRGFLVRHNFLSERQSTAPREYDEGPPLKKQRLGRYALDPERIECVGPSGPETLCEKDNDYERIDEGLYIDPNDGAYENEEVEIVWTDPATGETFVVDRRTGHSYLKGRAPGQDVEAANTGDGSLGERVEGRRTLVDRRWSKNAKDPCEHEKGKEEMPDWIKVALRENDVYELTELKIPALTLSSAFTNNDLDDSRGSKHHRCTYGVDPELLAPSTAGRFTKSDLRTAHVISQVDRKFIACLIRSEDEIGRAEALILLDQHAADERIRIERFLDELCSGVTKGIIKKRELIPPKPVLLTACEANRLKADSDSMGLRRAFECWGVCFTELDDLSAVGGRADNGEGDGYVQVLVRSVPEVLARKLLAGVELQELIKGYLARLEVEDFPPFIPEGRTSQEEAEELAWVKALRWCPKELIELANSKACRGAIMFNDTLTVAQRIRLVQQLSETAFPFQCAHGRPTLIPLADVNTGRNTRRVGVDWSRLNGT